MITPYLVFNGNCKEAMEFGTQGDGSPVSGFLVCA